MSDSLLTLEADTAELEQIARLAGYESLWNLFEVTGSVWREERHSDTLAFLLRPDAGHHLGDRFALQLMQAAGIAVPAGRFRHLTVTREWSRPWQNSLPRIDLLLIDDLQRFVVIVENKTASFERPSQLDTYWRMVQQYFAGWTIAGIYLTPDGRLPAEVPDRERYRAVSYATVCGLLESLIEEPAQALEPDTVVLIRHYTQILRREIMERSEELVQRCREFYRKHQQALDIIYQHRPDKRVEIYDLIITLIAETLELQFIWSRPDSSEICFAAKEWVGSAPLNQSGWPHSTLMLLFDVDNYANVSSLTLRMYIAPGSKAIRKRLRDMVASKPQLFSPVRDAYDGWIIMYEQPLIDTGAYRRLADEALSAHIRAGWSTFREQNLPAILTLVRKQAWIQKSLKDPLLLAEE
jgi:hypothetical protein